MNSHRVVSQATIIIAFITLTNEGLMLNLIFLTNSNEFKLILCFVIEVLWFKVSFSVRTLNITTIVIKKV